MVKKVLLWISVALSVASAGACVDVSYQRPGQTIAPRERQVLVFGHVRFFLDGVEFFPWKPALLPESAWRVIERHLWLLRLGERGISPEIHPDSDGALAIWLASGDYALVGSTEIPTAGPIAFDVLGLIRVPDGPISVYAGELSFKTERHEGGYAMRSIFGVASVAALPVNDSRADMEQRLGALPGPPVVSLWCVGEDLPGFDDPDLMSRAKEILDRGCAELSGRSEYLHEPETLVVPRRSYRSPLDNDHRLSALDLAIASRDVVVNRTRSLRDEPRNRPSVYLASEP